MLEPSLIAAFVGWLILGALVCGVVAAWALHRFAGGGPEGRLERDIQAEIEEGRYHRAVPYLVERGRLAEAARLEALRGNSDHAAKLYERAGDMKGAASVYLAKGDHQMAALIYKDADMKEEAAEAYLAGGRHDGAAHLFEELGQLEKAAEAWHAHGDFQREAKLLEKLGRGDEAARLLAQQLETDGRLKDAAQQWERAGELENAAAAWERGGEPLRAGSVMLKLGHHDKAASLLVKGGDFRGAGEVYARLGAHTQAAHAFYRAGELSKAVHLLTEGQDWLTLARIYLQHGKDSHAFNTLNGVQPDNQRYEEAQVLLAEIHRRQRRPLDAFRVYEALVARRVQEGRADAQVRRWIVIMGEILFKNGKPNDAIAVLERLEELGLMTRELQTRLDTLRARLSAPQAPSPDDHVQLAALTSTLSLPEHERYEFVDKLGEGGNGVIYRAVDKMLGRELAIKMIGQTALPSDLAKKFFLREAQTAAQLNHPGIVTIYDMGELDGASYIAMELIDGESLADRLAEGTGLIEGEAALGIIDQLCAALDYAHSHGVIHRDVKLENVMITRSGDVKLMDFGLAKAIHGSPDKSIVITGTPLYMSPEQIMGGDLDHRTDIYATGVMLYRMLSGHWPYFDGNILELHREAPIPDPIQHNPALPAGFREVIERTMAKKPDDRYECAGEVATAMREAFA